MPDAIDLSQQPPGTVPVTEAIPPQAQAEYHALSEASRHRKAEWAQDVTLKQEWFVDNITGEELLRLRFPGNRREIPVLGATPQNKARFRASYEAFKNKRSATAGQTELRDVAWVDEGARDLLDQQGIDTLESLAHVTDEHLRGLGPGVRSMRDRAKAEVKKNEDASAYTDLKQEMAQLRVQLAQLQSIPAPPSGRRPGRPRKTAE